jgi:hypothetical protein
MSERDLHVEITDDDILESLAWPGLPPGRWLDPDTGHIDLLLTRIAGAAPGDRRVRR